VTGSRCSSDGSTTSSRDRCSDLASDSLSPVAREVDTPHAVLAAIPAVSETDSFVPEAVLACVDREPPALGDSGSTPAPLWLDRPVPSDRDAFIPADAAAEKVSPTVLV